MQVHISYFSPTVRLFGYANEEKSLESDHECLTRIRTQLKSFSWRLLGYIMTNASLVMKFEKQNIYVHLSLLFCFSPRQPAVIPWPNWAAKAALALQYDIIARSNFIGLLHSRKIARYNEGQTNIFGQIAFLAL